MNDRERAEVMDFFARRYGRGALIGIAVGDAVYRLKTVPGTIFVCGLVVGYIAWLEARNRITALAKRARSIVNGS